MSVVRPNFKCAHVPKAAATPSFDRCLASIPVTRMHWTGCNFDCCNFDHCLTMFDQSNSARPGPYPAISGSLNEGVHEARQAFHWLLTLPRPGP